MRIRIDFVKRINFFRDYFRYRQQVKNDPSFPFGKLYPCLHDKDDQSGIASGHYFHQDLLVARKVFLHNPKLHVDIGSRIDGFVAHVASFREIEVLDVRALVKPILNVKFKQVDMISPNFELTDYCDSVSCLHALEHFGLGRYGDPLDYNGHLKGFNNICKLLQAGGKLYFSAPIGTQRVEFNAHRVFSLQYLLDLLDPKFEINSFSYVDDHGDLHNDITLTGDTIKNNLLCRYGCGIFELTKRFSLP